MQSKPPTDELSATARMVKRAEDNRVLTPDSVNKHETTKEDQEVAKIAQPANLRVKVNTKGVFVEADRLILPKSFIGKHTIREEQRKRQEIEN